MFHFTCVPTLAIGAECEGNVYGSVRLSVCVSVRTRDLTTMASIDSLCLHKKYFIGRPYSSNMARIGIRIWTKSFRDRINTTSK